MKFFGIPLRFDQSAIFLLLPVFMQTMYAAGDEDTSTQIKCMVIGGLLLVTSILFHERAHIFVAKHYGVGCGGIVVFALGAMALIPTMPETPFANFVVAIAGPLMSFALAALLGILTAARYVATTGESPMLRLVGLYSVFNLLMALFNFLPIYPMDGGRMVHSIFWKYYGSNKRGRDASIYLARGLLVVIVVAAGYAFVKEALPLVSLIWIMALSFFLFRIQEIEMKQAAESDLDIPQKK